MKVKGTLQQPQLTPNVGRGALCRPGRPECCVNLEVNHTASVSRVQEMTGCVTSEASTGCIPGLQSVMGVKSVTNGIASGATQWEGVGVS